MNPTAIRVALVCLGLLVISSVMILLGRDDTRSNPAATSYSPSGLRAFRALLEQEGFRVRVDGTLRPKLGPLETAIVISEDERLGVQPRGKFTSDEDADPPKTPLRDALTDHVKKGGRMLEIYLDQDFREATDNAGNTIALGSRDRFNISGKITTMVEPSWTYGGKVSRLYIADGFDFAQWVELDQGSAIVVHNGIGITNRFIDQQQNAAFYRQLVGALAGSQKSVVFIEAGHSGATSMGLLRTIGDWMVLGWWQMLILVAVVGYTLGRRLGLPEFERNTQVGQRQLVDALSEIYRRGNATGPTLRAYLHHSDRELRRIVKVAMDAPVEVFYERLPEDLQRLRFHVENAARADAPTDVAVKAAAAYDRAVREFIGRGRRSRR
jgi:hypothetical protein